MAFVRLIFIGFSCFLMVLIVEAELVGLFWMVFTSFYNKERALSSHEIPYLTFKVVWEMSKLHT